MNKFIFLCIFILAQILFAFFILKHCSLKRINETKESKLSIREAQIIFNWANLDSSKIIKITNSHISPKLLGGDYFEFAEISVSGYTRNDFEALIIESQRNNWYRCDKLPPIVLDVIKFLNDTLLDEYKWFSGNEIMSVKYYIYPMKMEYSTMTIGSVQILIADPDENRIFYYTAKIK